MLSNLGTLVSLVFKMNNFRIPLLTAFFAGAGALLLDCPFEEAFKKTDSEHCYHMQLYQKMLTSHF